MGECRFDNYDACPCGCGKGDYPDLEERDE